MRVHLIRSLWVLYLEIALMSLYGARPWDWHLWAILIPTVLLVYASAAIATAYAARRRPYTGPRRVPASKPPTIDPAALARHAHKFRLGLLGELSGQFVDSLPRRAQPPDEQQNDDAS